MGWTSSWVLVGVVVLLAWLYSKWRLSYWAKRGIKSPPTYPLLGHGLEFFMGKRWLHLDKYYWRYRDEKLFGLYEFLTPQLVVTDPELLKHFLIKDFEYFVDRRVFGEQEGSILNEVMTNKQGEEWKELRALMSPTFSSGKMRSMFPLICEKADTLVSSCLKQAATTNAPVNMKQMCGRFSMDTIASCAFGIECNSFSGPKPVFVEHAERFFDFRGFKGVKLIMMVFLPKLFNALGFKVDTPDVKFFAQVSRENTEAREKGQQKRGDFLDQLLEARDADSKSGKEKKVFGDKTVVAQSVMFLISGYDTTASTLSFACSLLARYPTQQRRLREELKGVVKEHEGKITYQGIMEAKYLDACINETLRIYPPGTLGERKCSRTYRVPGTDLIIHPGDIITFPIWSLHHDPRYWQDPDEFRPERFLPENRDKIKSFTHMPFGMGPRNCLAMRFALMESKVALAQLVLAAELKMAPGHEEPTFENTPFLLRPKDGVMVLLSPLKQD